MRRVLIIILLLSIQISSTPIAVFAQEEVSEASESAAVITPVLPELLPTIDPGMQAAIEEKNEPTPHFEAPKVDTSAVIRQRMHLRDLIKKDFKAGEDVVAIIDNAATDNLTFQVLNARGKKVALVMREIVYGSSRIIKVIPPSTLTPGKYTLSVKDTSGTVFMQDFTWGVLALNTNKSIYTPRENAYFSFAVLDEKGAMVCDAGIELRIKNNELRIHDVLSTENGTIKVNPECLVKDKVEKPDYEAMYMVGDEGTYDLQLTAETKNGTYEVSDSIQVQESVQFVVERFSSTRIYPAQPYEVTLKITANQDFDGIVSEMVPESFAITKQSGSSKAEVTEPVIADKAEDVLGAAVMKLGLPFEGEHKESLGFGEQIQDPSLKKTYEQFGLSGHDGIDFDMKIGTPILAADEGTVTLAKHADYGLTVVIQHAWGKSYYGHLSKITTSLGKVVTKGQQIGLSGNSGLSTGSHLHFGIKLTENDGENGYFGKIDPEPYLDLGGTKESNYAVKFLNWPLTLQKGDSTVLSYTYDAQDKSPEFYTVGPLAFHSTFDQAEVVFQEARKWQIAVDATTHMLLFWDPANGAAPSGWSVVTAYDGRFIRGEAVANVLTTGGNPTHTPTVSGAVGLSVPSSGRAAAGTNTVSSYGHTHGTPSVTVGNDDNLPSFRSMQLIQYDAGIPTSIPQNAIALFDASPGMPGSGWTRVTAQDTRMLRINSTVVSNGQDTHTHSLTWGALTAASGQITTGSNTNNQGATTTHTHTAPSATNSDSQTSLPPYVHSVVASADSTIAIPTGMIAMFDGQPSASYSVQSESGGAFYQKFVRGNTAANVGTTGGTATHSHAAAASGASGAASANARGTATAGTTAAGNGHTHTLSATFTASDDHTPEYVNVVVAEKIDVADLTQIHSRWRNDDGSETTATWRRSEDVSATADVGVNRRLRMEISNEGTLSSSSITYRLEYGLLATTCDAIVTWTAVPSTATTERFEMFNSTNLTDGNATTNVAGGLTDENTSFVAGQVKDTGNQTTGITLTASEFTEIEYSIKVTSNATAGQEYCFRLTNAGSTTNFTYSLYPQLTIGDPVIDLKHYRWRNDDSTETATTGNTVYYNPTGDGFASAFTIAAGCTNEWDCVDDGIADTSASEPTNDGATSALTTANGNSYFTLADDGIMSGSTVTRLDVFAYAIDTGNPNTSIQLGYCTTCNGANNSLGAPQAVNVGSYTQYTSAFTGLSLTTADLNNMQLVVSADGVRANISTVYVLVTYSKPGATWKQSEDTLHSGQATLENIRLRVTVANTGNVAANRNYRLEYSAKTGASCGDDETFITVPVTATSEHFEMTTSNQFADGDATTTQLTATGLGTFDAGKMVEDPSTSSGTFVATNGRYSEFEYNFQATAAASGYYCFRVSDNGTAIDAYTVYPEISIGTGPTLEQLLLHGKWFSGGTVQPFTF